MRTDVSWTSPCDTSSPRSDRPRRRISTFTTTVTAHESLFKQSPPASAFESDRWRGHLPALDGVRGLAIALVMFCHMLGRFAPTALAERGLVEVARAGWIGVDLFFVLSGFLITGILLDARGAPNYFRNFYIRRTLRIFPLYYAILIGVFVVAPLVAGAAVQHWFGNIADSEPWFWAYASNVRIAVAGNWSVTGALGHFWSLAVEEQFYLVWPAVVFLLSPRHLRRACLAIMIGALGLRFLIALSDAPDLGAFVLMPARADTLAAGAWLAVAVRTGTAVDTIRLHARWLLAISVAALGALFVWYRGLSEADFLTETIGFSFLAVGGAALLSLALDGRHRPTATGTIFRNSTLRMLGKYSYAMYCFHPLIQTLLRAAGVEPAMLPVVGGSVLPSILAYCVVVVALTLAASWLSWNLFEKHFLALKDRFTTARPSPATHSTYAPEKVVVIWATAETRRATSSVALPASVSQPSRPTPTDGEAQRAEHREMS